eukprot:1160594-Pelagomonas_calceolata.AAC.3
MTGQMLCKKFCAKKAHCVCMDTAGGEEMSIGAPLGSPFVLHFPHSPVLFLGIERVHHLASAVTSGFYLPLPSRAPKARGDLDALISCIVGSLHHISQAREKEDVERWCKLTEMSLGVRA